MNFELPHIPERPTQPRTHGVTMMMDKGLSLRQAEDFCEACGPYTDFVKLGFATALIATKLEEKLAI